jgi:hypothetical protein
MSDGSACGRREPALHAAPRPARAWRAVRRSVGLRAAAIAVAAIACGACSVDSDVSRALGARCDRGTECDERCLAPSAAYPGGLCTTSCEVTADCPARASCVAAESGVCLFECQTDAACRFLGPAWRCVAEPLRLEPTRTVTVCRGA